MQPIPQTDVHPDCWWGPDGIDALVWATTSLTRFRVARHESAIRMPPPQWIPMRSANARSTTSTYWRG
jgi:hypothetical protein